MSLTWHQKRRERKWNLYLPGNFYAIGPFFATSRRAARLQVLSYLNVDKLPKHTAIMEQ